MRGQAHKLHAPVPLFLGLIPSLLGGAVSVVLPARSSARDSCLNLASGGLVWTQLRLVLASPWALRVERGSGQGRHAISGRRGCGRIWAVLRFSENGGFVVLARAVCDGVIFGEQWYTGNDFLELRGEALELRRPGNCFLKRGRPLKFCILKIQFTKLFSIFNIVMVLNKRHGVRGGAPAKFFKSFFASEQMSRTVELRRALSATCCLCFCLLIVFVREEVESRFA